MDILEKIVATKRDEVAALRAAHHELADEAACVSRRKPSLREALLADAAGIIAEFKRRSPSKGWIHESARPDVVAPAYQHAGAAALSILTDEHYFGGSDDYIRQARAAGVTLPILYKNFVIDECQLYAAALCGASAVLLIAACLTQQRCAELIAQAHDLGLEVLLEMHNDRDFEYAELGPDLYGINNRNLNTFHVDLNTSVRLAQALRERLGDDTLIVSESGIHGADDVHLMQSHGIHHFLIGEQFMKTDNVGLALEALLNSV